MRKMKRYTILDHSSKDETQIQYIELEVLEKFDFGAKIPNEMIQII